MTTDDAPRPALDAATLERLRRRYTPRQPRCSVCNGVMAADETIGVVGGILSRAWYCVAAVEAPRGAPGLDAHLSRGWAFVPVGDPDVLALLRAYAAAAARADALAGEVERLRAALPSPCPEHGIDHMGLTRRWGWLNRPAADSVPVWACHHEGISGEPDCDFWHQITSEGCEALTPREGDDDGR